LNDSRNSRRPASNVRPAKSNVAVKASSTCVGGGGGVVEPSDGAGCDAAPDSVARQPGGLLVTSHSPSHLPLGRRAWGRPAAPRS
jgi:hypothetical protein